MPLYITGILETAGLNRMASIKYTCELVARILSITLVHSYFITY